MNPPPSRAYHIVIPARFASERLPGKVLLDLGGETVLQRVWRRATASAAATVTIATDDERVFEAAAAFGAHAVMTERAHPSGSDRIAECATRLGWPENRLLVNLQADEPLMPVACLDQVAELLLRATDCEAASLYWPVADEGELRDPNVVKVVTDRHDRALYFSRSPVPYAREHASWASAAAAGLEWKRHLGLYAYRLAALKRFTATAPTPLETTERLEQLRILESGGRIAMAKAREPIPPGIDSAADLERVRRRLEALQGDSP